MCGFCDRRSFLAYTTTAFASAILGKEVAAQQPSNQNVDKPIILNRSYLQEANKPGHFSRSYKRQTEAIAQNVRAIGYSDVDGRPAFKLSIREHLGRWYLYTGHFWHSGWSIIDVTDPTQPKVVKFIAGPENTWTLQMELSGNTMITALEQIFPNFGGSNRKPFDSEYNRI